MNGKNSQSAPLILYLSPYDILRPRTNQVSDVRFSEGFAQNDCEVHLITPYVFRKDNLSKEDVGSVYGLKNPINIHYLATKFKKDVTGKWRTILVSLLSFLKTIQLLRNRNNLFPTYIFSRSVYLLLPLLQLRKIIPTIFKNTKIIFWAHDFNTTRVFLSIYKNSDALLATNSSISEDICKSTGISISKIFITLNPVTEAQVKDTLSKTEARKKLKLESLDRPLIVYTGKIAVEYNEELQHILESAAILSTYQYIFTGGKPDAIVHWKNWCEGRNIKNVIFTGYLTDYGLIKYYQAAADVLVSYYTKQGHDVRYNLPNKLCEYMLSGNIIITPDYPATRDLLNNENCLFVEAENSLKLVECIQYAINHPEEIQIKTKLARKNVEEITFKKKTIAVLSFLKNN